MWDLPGRTRSGKQGKAPGPVLVAHLLNRGGGSGRSPAFAVRPFRGKQLLFNLVAVCAAFAFVVKRRLR